jgi:hypothetical protein
MMLTDRENIAAVLDANVLYSAALRDYHLYLASLGVYDPRWTDAIQEEWIRNLLKARPDLNRSSLEAVQRSMDKKFYRSKIVDYEAIVEGLSLPDPRDRHVLAAAIKGGAKIIVTANLKDFPGKILAPYNIRAEHPDDFVLSCITREKENAIKALENQVKFLKNPPLSVEKVLENLRRCGLVKSAEKLRGYLQ